MVGEGLRLISQGHLPHEGSAEWEMPFPHKGHDLNLCPTSSYLQKAHRNVMQGQI